MLTAHIFDGMAQVHMLGNSGSKSFRELALKHYERITAPLGHDDCRMVDLVFDRYQKNFIKDGERVWRGGRPSIEINIHNAEMPIPKQWEKYIDNQKNKQGLCAFLSEEMCSWWMSRLREGHQMVIAGGFRDEKQAVFAD